MKNYSIVRIGHEYVVRTDEQSVLKIASRRRAAKLVTDAAGLLDDAQRVPQLSPEETEAGSPAARDPSNVS